VLYESGIICTILAFSCIFTAVVYHWFCEYFVSAILCILKVEAFKNLPEIFTKRLFTENFTAIRNYSLDGNCSAERESYTRTFKSFPT
jgi:hypothetical protein